MAKGIAVPGNGARLRRIDKREFVSAMNRSRSQEKGRWIAPAA
jgi:hypothetical protein